MGHSVEKEQEQKEKIKLLSRELRMVQKNLVEQFYTDPLTRLPNLYKLRHDLEELSEFTLIIANITSVKLIDIGPFTFDGGTIIFPLAYIL